MDAFEEIVDGVELNNNVDFPTVVLVDGEKFKRIRTRLDDPYAEGFAVVGPLGAIEVWKMDHPQIPNNFGWMGGVEYHSAAPWYWDNQEKPSQSHCMILDAPCWHDGSSLALQLFEQRDLWGEAVYAELETYYEEMWGEGSA